MEYNEHVKAYYEVRTYCLSCGKYLKDRYCTDCRGGQ